MLPGPLQSVFIEEVFSQRAVCLNCSDASQATNIIAQLLDGVVTVDEEMLLEEIAELQNKYDIRSSNRELIKNGFNV